MSQHDSDGESHEEVDQEKILDEALLIVKSQAYQMKNAIENNKLRNSLKFCKAMLDTLKSSTLSPAGYYQLYTNVFDEIQYIYNYFKEEARRGRRMKDLYDTVQQCESIIPRLFLLICVASAYIETGQVSASDIIFDLFNLVKGVQNPLRGLFCRYFLLKMIKDKMPDKGNEYEKVGASPNDSIKFILNNLSEMNSLWTRIKSVGESEKIVTDSERAQFKILVGENITRLASLNAITLDIYKNTVLPKILEILLESKDALSQQYLLECLIRAFPDEFNISCMSQIIEVCGKLQKTVDVVSLFISLMSKLSRFCSLSPEKTTEIFSLLRTNVESLVKGDDIEVERVVELESEFIKFTIKCSDSEEEQVKAVNEILSEVAGLLSKRKTDNPSKTTTSLLSRLLAAPLESKISIFRLTSFPELMRYLDFASRSTISVRIIESLLAPSNPSSVLDTPQKVSALMDFIRPLLEDSPDSPPSDAIQTEYEQTAVSKAALVATGGDTSNVYDMLCVLKNTFVKGGNKRIKYTLPVLVNSLLLLANRVLREGVTGAIDSDDTLKKFLKRIYNLALEVINIVEGDFPEIAFKLHLSLCGQLNFAENFKEAFAEVCYSSLESCINLLNKGKIEENSQVPLVHMLVNVLLNLNILSKEDYFAIAENVVKASQTLLKKGDQCLAILSCSHLYHNTLIADKSKISDCLLKAKKFADFAMTNPRNAVLFIKIINKYVYYLDKAQSEEDIDFINAENINDLIELVKNHIQSMKHENKETDFLPEIEEYFNNTMFMLNLKRKEGKNKVYSSLMA